MHKITFKRQSILEQEVVNHHRNNHRSHHESESSEWNEGNKMINTQYTAKERERERERTKGYEGSQGMAERKPRSIQKEKRKKSMNESIPHQ